MDRVKRIWYLSPMRAAKVQASLRIRAVSPEPSLLAHTSSESRGTFRRKARSLAPLNGWACAVKICHDGMLEDTNSLDGAHIITLTDSRFSMRTIPKKDLFVNFYTVNSCLSKYFTDCKSKERLFISALKQNKTHICGELVSVWICWNMFNAGTCLSFEF